MAKLVDESSIQPFVLRVEFGGRSERRTRGQIESRGYGEARSDGREDAFAFGQSVREET